MTEINPVASRGGIEYRNCATHDSCQWLHDVGSCPVNCNLYKNRDEILVVRCKNCKHWDIEHPDDRQGWCLKVVGYRHGDWYCAAGENLIREEFFDANIRS